MTRSASRPLRLLAGVLSVGVGLVALRYALPSAPGTPPDVAANSMIQWLPAHALTAAFALVLGPFQFLRGGKGPGSRWHRLSGRAYVLACLLSAPAGLMLAIGTSAGPVAALGFGLLAVGWFATTALGLARVLQGRIEAHRRWMIYSYAFAFSAVTLRLYLPAALVAGLDYAVAFPAISFLCWVPNLLVAEGIVRRWTPRRGAPALQPRS